MTEKLSGNIGAFKGEAFGTLHPDRWDGIIRPYTSDYLERIAPVEDTLERARHRAEKLWDMLHQDGYVRALGAQTGLQATQMIRGGLKAIYVSGWQVAADANTDKQTLPDQSLYNADSVPQLTERINNALRRSYEIDFLDGKDEIDWKAPIIADLEAGYGGTGGIYNLTISAIKSGAAAVHFEDQLGSEKKCGHLGGKVLLPTQMAIDNLVQARKAADSLKVPTLIIARTDAMSATFLSTDIDETNHKYMIKDENGKPLRTPGEGFYHIKGGLDSAIERAIAYAPYADMLWCETSTPNLAEAQAFADAIHDKFPDKLLAYNCSPSFNWKENLSDDEIAEFQNELGKMGYQFPFVTLAGFHSINYSMFELASAYNVEGMSAYVRLLQEKELAAVPRGYTAVKHQHEVGAGFMDHIRDNPSTSALQGSTEEAQFI